VPTPRADLQKLWIVLLKERNMLHSTRLLHRKRKTTMPHRSRLTATRKSMAMIKLVLHERQLEKAERDASVACALSPARPPRLSSLDAASSAHHCRVPRGRLRGGRLVRKVDRPCGAWCIVPRALLLSATCAHALDAPAMVHGPRPEQQVAAVIERPMCSPRVLSSCSSLLASDAHRFERQRERALTQLDLPESDVWPPFLPGGDRLMPLAQRLTFNVGARDDAGTRSNAKGSVVAHCAGARGRRRLPVACAPAAAADAERCAASASLCASGGAR
jgi:hypothetical protein